MPEGKRVCSVMPSVVGSRGCGCLVILLLIMSAFVVGVVYSEEAKKRFNDLKQDFYGDVSDKIETIKDKVD